MTDSQDLIREIQEHTAAHGGENTSTHLLVQFEKNDGYRLEGAVPRAWALSAYGELRRQHACIAELEAQLEAIGAGGVNGPLMGQPQAMPDLSELTERGAKAWAGVDAQALREGGTDMSKEREAFIAFMLTFPRSYTREIAEHYWANDHVSALAWRAGRASLSANAGEPTQTDEWKVRGYLAKTLTCWHRLTGEEAAELVAMTLRLSGLYPTTQPAPATEQQAYDMGAKGAPATEAERLLFEAWMRGHCWALCATWDGKSYRSDAEQGGNIDPRAMNTRQLWAAWRDRAALAAPPTAQAEGWISVDERLPEPNVEVLCAGQGWGKPFVTACYYDDGRSEWYPINTYWTDSTGSAQYPTHWMPLPPPPTSAEGVEHGPQ